ncbi:hypothetical protein DVH24_012622 [Malus domestica]|uniref:PITH domain-containing protein n=1 Tax=Malus domestica TaxID=3750 RepID=A0A498HN42_MALDO|nr:hypothetical protein DVH24_012622 [Malus domestica]
MACLHDHSCEDHDCSSGWTLYENIDLPKVSALNEAVPGSVKSVFKAWEQRLNSSGVTIPSLCVASEKNNRENKKAHWSYFLLQGHLESNEGDPELLVYIPFTSDVKIKSISVVGGVDGTSPSKMRAFINKEGIDFSDAQGMQAIQEWDLVENFQGTLEYQTRYSKFQNVASITLHFPDSFGGDTTKIEYIGFKGEATKLKRDVVATIVYELRPNPSDHKPKVGVSHMLNEQVKRWDLLCLRIKYSLQFVYWYLKNKEMLNCCHNPFICGIFMTRKSHQKQQEQSNGQSGVFPASALLIPNSSSV